jgi:hypothetical protein
VNPNIEAAKHLSGNGLGVFYGGLAGRESKAVDRYLAHADQ